MGFNPITNGAFDIWPDPRGTVFPNFPGGGYHAARWTYSNKGSSCVHTISRSDDVPTVGQAGVKLNYSVRLEVTTPENNIVPETYVAILHKIEGYNSKAVMGKPFYLPFWVKARRTGTYCVGIGNYYGNDRYITIEYPIYQPMTWEKKVIAINFHDGMSGTWNFKEGVGIGILWTLVTGSNHIGPGGSWVNGPVCATANQVNGCDTLDCDFWIAVVGEAFDRTIQEETLLCKRYYEVHGGTLAGFPIYQAFNGAGTSNGYGVPFQVEKRIPPQITVNGIWTTYNCSQPAAVNPSKDGYYLQTIVNQTGQFCFYPAGADCFIEARCEL